MKQRFVRFWHWKRKPFRIIQIEMPIKYLRCRSSYSLISMFLISYLVLTILIILYSKNKILSLIWWLIDIFSLVKTTEIKSEIKPWEQLSEMYPGLVEPIRESWHDPLSIRKIYMVTPSKTRAEQLADLTRLAQTLYLVKTPNLSFFPRWIDPCRFLISSGLSSKMKHNPLDVFIVSFNHSIYHLFI